MTSVCSTTQNLVQLCDKAVDWSATGSMLSGWGTLIGAAGVIYAASVGFSQWRKQKLAERQIDQAEKILAAAAQAKRALERVRSAWMDGSELSRAKDDLKDAQFYQEAVEQHRSRMETAQAYINRLKRAQEYQQELDKCHATTMAILNNDLGEAIRSLNHQFSVIQVYAEEYADRIAPAGDEMAKVRAALWQHNRNRADEVSVATAEAITTIENACKPHVTMETGKVGFWKRWRKAPLPDSP